MLHSTTIFDSLRWLDIAQMLLAELENTAFMNHRIVNLIDRHSGLILGLHTISSGEDYIAS